MNCNNNGMTYVNTCIPAPGATATDATYVLDLTHYLCGNRKVCVNAAYPLTANLNYQVRGIEDVGNKTFNCDILVYGTVTYMPHKQGCNPCYPPCPLTDNVWTVLTVPVTADTTPTITAGTCVCDPANVRDCCNVTNAVSIRTSFNVTQAAAASEG